MSGSLGNAVFHFTGFAHLNRQGVKGRGVYVEPNRAVRVRLGAALFIFPVKTSIYFRQQFFGVCFKSASAFFKDAACAT